MQDKEKAKDPNINIRDLSKLARVYPYEVLENPVLPLISLEDPDLYNRITEDCYYNIALIIRLRFYGNYDISYFVELLVYLLLGGKKRDVIQGKAYHIENLLQEKSDRDLIRKLDKFKTENLFIEYAKTFTQYIIYKEMKNRDIALLLDKNTIDEITKYGVKFYK